MSASSRVLFVCTQMEAGGVQVRAIRMAGALRAKGRDAWVVFIYRKRGTFDGTPHVHCLFPHRPRNVWEYAKAVFALFRYVIRLKPTTIVGLSRYSSPLATVAGAIAGARARIATQTNPPSTFPLVARILDYACGTLGLYTRNIVPSQMIASCFSRYPQSYRKALAVVYNGVPTAASSYSRASARTVLGYSEADRLLVSCGRLALQKNQRLLLDVVAALPEYRLAIAGEGELRTALEAEIKAREINARVRLLGEIPSTDVARLLRAGDIFLFPSKHEAFGLAAVEAMREGTPVIASDHPALVEVIGDAGLFAPHDNPDAWVKAIRLLETDVTLARSKAAAGIDRAALFTFEAMLAGFEAHFE